MLVCRNKPRGSKAALFHQSVCYIEHCLFILLSNGSIEDGFELRRFCEQGTKRIGDSLSGRDIDPAYPVSFPKSNKTAFGHIDAELGLDRDKIGNTGGLTTLMPRRTAIAMACTAKKERAFEE
ncbi:hypothetical protein VTN77DRAFT_9751 [Rasamsonia byssochlamydoides]|uniref:uncharacterized protein n=1 Tax=Rasamsonia byssochlamydoides TaxID=89139 RepID=UPI0037431AD5